MNSPQRTTADRFLESALLATLLVHIVALITMASVLLPAMPGAGLATPELRLAYIQSHPILWHVGWLPWHFSAISDLFLSVALVRSKWIPSRISTPTLAITTVAFVIEQLYETRWDVFAPRFSASAPSLTELASYGAFEHSVFIPVCCIAAALYAVMAIGWSISLSRASTWTRWLSTISCIVWPVLFFAATAPLVPLPFRVSNVIVNTANQIGFVLMTLWFVLVLEAVLRQTRVDETFGRMTPWRSPSAGILGELQEAVSNSRFLQYLAEFLPKPVLSSHIDDVVYVNYLVSAKQAALLLPAGLELQTLGLDGSLTLFSTLIYRHGRFGPRALGGGASCRGFPSPIQSNWRLYVRDIASGETGIFFVTTTLSKLPAALIARTLSRGVPMHVPQTSIVAVSYSSDDGGDHQTTSVHVEVIPGRGSSPDMTADLSALGDSSTLTPGEWTSSFNTYADLLEYAVPQGRALSVQSWDGRITAQEIDLPAPPDSCIPLTGDVSSSYIRQLFGDVHPVCFLLPEVHFTMIGERTLHPGMPVTNSSI